MIVTESAYPGQKEITCRYFASGYCRSGDTCPYKHDITQHGTMSNLAILYADPTLVHQSKPVCRFYAASLCRNGDSCTFEDYADGQISSDTGPVPGRRTLGGPAAVVP